MPLPLGPRIARRLVKRTAITGLRSAPQRLWVQRAGLSLEDARLLVAATTLHGNVPEPLRLAHLSAGGIASGRSRGRP
jgi:endonuclease V-like protein UPF0215 family